MSNNYTAGYNFKPTSSESVLEAAKHLRNSVLLLAFQKVEAASSSLVNVSSDEVVAAAEELTRAAAAGHKVMGVVEQANDITMNAAKNVDGDVPQAVNGARGAVDVAYDTAAVDEKPSREDFRLAA